MEAAGDQSPPVPRACRIAVIGGGITGLAAAHRLLELAADSQTRLHITLFEAADRVGGLFGSERIGDYLIERGADSFITNKSGAVKLCRRLGIEESLIPTDARYRRSLILHRGRPVPTPEGFNLLAPGRLWPMVTTPLLSWRGKLRFAAELFVPRRADQSDESLADFVRRHFGTEVLDRIVQPMVGGIYTSDPERLSVQATLGRFVEMEHRHGSLIRGMLRTRGQSSESASGARYGLFATPREGMQALLDALARAIQPKIEIRLSTQVVAIQRAANSWEVRTGAGHSEDFDGVIIALPAPAAAALLSPVDADCAAALSQFEYASSAIMVTGHSLADIDHPMDAFGLVIPHREGRRILAVSFLSRKFPGRAPEGKIILRTFVGGAMQPEEFNRSDEQIRATVLAELRSIFGVRKEPDFAVLARYPRSMPQFHVGHLQRVAGLRDQVRRLSHLELAGNYLDGVGVPDSIQSGEEAAELLLKSLGRAA